MVWFLTVYDITGHCRRRKIRCLLSKEDSQGRCSNCIRLKKDCNFYPVDQNNERRPRSLSKPDISTTNETCSSASSPSPGLALGRLPPAEVPSAYAASVPVTPTCDYHRGILEDNLEHRSISSVTSGRLSIPHSAAPSRKPSLVHILPTLKTDHEYHSSPGLDSPNHPHIAGLRMNSLSNSPSQVDQPGLEFAFWRLTSSPMTPSQFSVYSNHIGLGSMPSLTSPTPSDTPENSTWPSRMNSIDNGLVSGYTYPTYPGDIGLPELYSISASASTTSLTAPAPDAPQFADSRVSAHPLMGSWSDSLPMGGSFYGGGTIKNNAYDGSYPSDGKYQIITEETSPIFSSPLQSPKFVS